MHILALTCALCLVVCNVTSAEDKQLKEEDIDDKIIGDSVSRQKRSLFVAGREAVKLLLHNARRYRRQENAVLYIKFGDYNQAVRDFYSVKPRFIKNTKQTDAGAKTTVVKSGHVGDRFLTLVKGEASEPAILTISKSKDISEEPGTQWALDIIYYFK